MSWEEAKEKLRLADFDPIWRLSEEGFLFYWLVNKFRAAVMAPPRNTKYDCETNLRSTIH